MGIVVRRYVAVRRDQLTGDISTLLIPEQTAGLAASGEAYYAHRQAIIQGLAAASTVIVYNEEARRRVLPFNQDTRVVPSGVDTGRYARVPPLASVSAECPVVLLAPGRLSDPVKGGAVLLEACDRLWARRLSPVSAESEPQISGNFGLAQAGSASGSCDQWWRTTMRPRD